MEDIYLSRVARIFDSGTWFNLISAISFLIGRVDSPNSGSCRTVGNRS